MRTIYASLVKTSAEVYLHWQTPLWCERQLVTSSGTIETVSEKPSTLIQTSCASQRCGKLQPSCKVVDQVRLRRHTPRAEPPKSLKKTACVVAARATKSLVLTANSRKRKSLLLSQKQAFELGV